MRLARRALKVVAALLVVVIAVLVVLVGDITARGLARTSGEVRIPELHGPVTVARDRHGIIHITADDPHDLFVAQGYVHAQERMWQMEVSRRIGAGRLAELFGVSQLDTDRFIRTLGWRGAAERDLDALAPDTIAALEAYAKGVNAWIEQHDGRLPAAFVVAGLLSGSGGAGGFELEPWTALDSATWQKVQAWSLGGNVDAEIFRLLADARLGDPARVDELFPAYGDWAPVITPSGLPGSGGAGADAAGRVFAGPARVPLTTGQADALAGLGRINATVRALAGLDGGGGLVGDHGVGSNNWVVSGTHTASGKPILANDPHLGFAMPSVWIINGLHCRRVADTCPWDVAGVSFPGAPAVILGHNARIAWGATNVGPDTQDLFLETVTPDGASYVAGGVPLPFEVRRETIRVAGAEDVEIEVRATHHGPLLSDVDERLEDGPLLALSWASVREPDRTLDAILAINIAADFDEFRTAFEVFGQPSQNFVYTDVDGHIGYVLPGRIPLRAGDPGERVRDGASSEDDWTGWVPLDALPWQLDPPSGVIVTANNAPVDANYPYSLGPDAEWDPGYRAARIHAVLDDWLTAEPESLTADRMHPLQLDPYMLRTDTAVARLVTLAPAPATAGGQAVLDAIEAWDRGCGTESRGCAAYASLELYLQRALFDDELGPLAREYVGSPPSWVTMIELLDDPDSAWWDDVTTAQREDAATIVGQALDRAGAELRATLGGPEDWRWGRLHRVVFRESTLGGSGIAALEWYFNAEPREVAGADGTINNSYYRFSRMYPDPHDPSYQPVGLDRVFEVTNGPSVRFVIDMADLDGARIVITTGQSGNPFDPHYSDMVDLWVSGRTVPLPFSPAAIEAAAVSTLTLSP